MHLQAIIFDFDGVLADSERLHLRAFRGVLEEAGFQLSEVDYLEKYLGLEDADVFLSVARDCSRQLARSQLEGMLGEKAARYQAMIASSPVLYPGVEELVREWSASVPLAIVSGALRAEIDAILGRVDLARCFTTIVSAEDVMRGKPAPDGYLLALGRLGEHRAEARCHNGRMHDLAARTVPADHEAEALCHNDRIHALSANSASDAARGFSPAKCVVIEDSPFGLQAAKAVGLRTVAVTTNHTADRVSGADLIVPSVAALDLEALDGVVQRGRE